jgi:hypothetical protein
MIVFLAFWSAPVKTDLVSKESACYNLHIARYDINHTPYRITALRLRITAELSIQLS